MIDDDAERQLRALLDYMAGWNSKHDRNVTDHEIQSMRFAASEALLILDGSGHGTGLHSAGKDAGRREG